ncbi:hypothetical protein [Sphingomonas oryzagri]
MRAAQEKPCLPPSIVSGLDDPALLASALVTLGIALALPFGPLAGPLGFAPPGIAILGAILVLVLAYLGAAVLMKRIARGYEIRDARA